MSRRKKPKSLIEKEQKVESSELKQEELKEVVKSEAAGVEIESSKLSQEQADSLASKMSEKAQSIQKSALDEKKRGAIRQYAFSIYNSLIMANRPMGDENTQKKLVTLSVNLAKSFIKNSKDFDVSDLD